jgi:glycosyltransferase involved in cell wall biosynthesis
MSSSKPFGFNVIGYLSGNLGLGVSARHLTSLLLDNGHPVAVLDMDPGIGRGGHDLSFDAYKVKSPEALPYGINLAVLAIPSLPSYFLDPPTVLDGGKSSQPGADYWLAEDRLNAAVVWWELPVLPEAWIRALEAFDVVVAPSPYIRATLETHLSNVAIVPAVHPFRIPHGVEASRERFGLPGDTVLFISSFEPTSDPERKNPFAAIDAFQRAFANDPRANLVIKLNNAHTAGRKLLPILAKLHERCNGDRRLRIIDEVLSYREVLCLYASCDAFVSLHRSEGFGFGLLETMALGKPVIATAWSGNMAFLNQANSCLIGYRLVPVDAHLAVYTTDFLGRESVWADPDVDQAAAWMKKLVDDPAMRRSLGLKAALDASAFQKEASKAQFVEELRALWQNRAFLPRRKTEDKLKGLEEVRQALLQQQEAKLPYGKRLHNQIRRVADRHFLWRFR